MRASSRVLTVYAALSGALLAAVLGFTPMVVLAMEARAYHPALLKVSEYLLVPGVFVAKYLFPAALHASGLYFVCVCSLCFLLYFAVIYAVLRTLVENRGAVRA